MNPILIFVPIKLAKNEIGTLQGYVDHHENNLAFYITNEQVSSKISNCIGYCSDRTPVNVTELSRDKLEWIHLNNKTGEVNVYNLSTEVKKYQTLCVSYDYQMFKSANVDVTEHQNYGENFNTLIKLLKVDGNEEDFYSKSALWGVCLSLINVTLYFLDCLLKLFLNLDPILNVSVVANHAKANIVMIRWMLMNIKMQKQIPLRVANAACAKIVDFMLGIAVLYYIFEYESELSRFSEEFTESVIENLEELLDFLMGAPVGLKLNYSFNKTLGTFFVYHISLWRTFLRTTHPLLIFGLRMLALPGAFGLSFQIAVFSDLIAFSTFHVYCIYVCAARLYGLQLRSLISLWRLFIGRKYNPLRDRIDSHQYTHHQLFIGTLGFTLLLFLMPTSIMYYTVFTTFRIVLIVVADILIGVRYMLQCQPLYVTGLWLINSKYLQGEIFLKIQNEPLTVRVSLHRTSFWKSIKTSLPHNLHSDTQMSWRKILHSAMTGNLL